MSLLLCLWLLCFVVTQVLLSFCCGVPTNSCLFSLNNFWWFSSLKQIWVLDFELVGSSSLHLEHLCLLIFFSFAFQCNNVSCINPLYICLHGVTRISCKINLYLASHLAWLAEL